jgi:hypothetical protein
LVVKGESQLGAMVKLTGVQGGLEEDDDVVEACAEGEDWLQRPS